MSTVSAAVRMAQSQATSKTEINWIISEYLKRELQVKGHTWQPKNRIDRNELILSDGRRENVVECLIVLSRLVRKAYKAQLARVCTELDSKLDDLTRLDYESFKTLADELFDDEVKWSHVICLLVFATELILITLNDNPSRELIENVFYFLCTYLNAHLLSWINEHGAWDGLLAYSNSHSLDDESVLNKFTAIWSNKSVKIGTISLVSVLLLYCIFILRKK